MVRAAHRDSPLPGDQLPQWHPLRSGKKVNGEVNEHDRVVTGDRRVNLGCVHDLDVYGLEMRLVDGRSF
jgi:hypothetical protein